MDVLLRYILYPQPQRRSFAKFAFLWIRYYTLALLTFDVLQIHIFSIQRVHTDKACVVIDPITRIAGAISLWSVEIVMQLRIYALYGCSKPIAWFNGVLFIGSVASFIYILYHNVSQDGALISAAVHLPLPGCPVIHVDTEWAQWIPGLAFEAVLCGFALYKTMHRTYNDVLRKKRLSLENILLRDNVLYFIGVALLLTFNILMSKVNELLAQSIRPFEDLTCTFSNLIAGCYTYSGVWFRVSSVDSNCYL
ncbi:hypothetical protein FISHEDRAFT_50696 [Fistulina hepatica ATCC 64428]|uniref:Uncharacterized protein n=1 Tax=Fistulina hepatica ATCC 64428 TaxID=1128425 RepID=A0A0D7A282_9AGAR|nr:hypothetical protein FISHEDRAFT_50696 [Fistulina hepatica ATCC 64428]